VDTNRYLYAGLDSLRQPRHGNATLDSKPVFKSFALLPPMR